MFSLLFLLQFGLLYYMADVRFLEAIDFSHFVDGGLSVLVSAIGNQPSETFRNKPDKQKN